MHIESAAFTHVGRRSNNEDRLLSAPELGVFAVADGMGGYEGGEVASQITVETLRDFYRRNFSDDDVTWPFGLEADRSLDENMASVATRIANARVIERRSGRLKSMGSTVASVVVRHGHAVVSHVGDSRVYRVRSGKLEPLTRDHSLYEEMLATGANVGPRSNFPHANVITRALGMSTVLKVDTHTERLRVGDVFLLCTDGLYDAIDEARLVALMTRETPADAARTMVEEAYENGSRDNITVVVVKVTA